MAEEDAARVEIEKIYAISYEDEPPANARDAEDRKTAGLFNEARVIPPAYPIEDLVRRVEESSILRQCIDTMAMNCDQFGYRLVPFIDLKAKDADQHIADAMLLERLYDAAMTGRDDAAAPTEQEVAARRQELELELEMKKEHAWTARTRRNTSTSSTSTTRPSRRWRCWSRAGAWPRSASRSPRTSSRTSCAGRATSTRPSSSRRRRPRARRRGPPPTARCASRSNR